MTSAADAILRQHAANGAKIVFWDGIAITANSHGMEVEIGPGQSFTTVGGHLRERLGPKYLSVMIGFGEGEIHAGVRVPAPPVGYVEADLPDVAAFTLDLRAEAPGTSRRGCTAAEGQDPRRVYNPAEDEKHHVVSPSLAKWFDALVYFPPISPTTLLKSAAQTPAREAHRVEAARAVDARPCSRSRSSCRLGALGFRGRFVVRAASKAARWRMRERSRWRRIASSAASGCSAMMASATARCSTSVSPIDSGSM